MLYLYRFFSLLLWPLLPLLALQTRIRAGFKERLALGTLQIEPGGIWIHAASLGEGRIATALIAALREQSSLPILRTCTSISARSMDIGADQSLLLPLDIWPFPDRLLNRVRPRLLILVEAELWPGLIATCAARGIPVWVVGARVGAGMDRLLKIPGLWASLRKKIHWLPVDAAAAAIGGGEPTGDLKGISFTTKGPALRWRGKALIGACTYAEEEEALLAAWEGLQPRPLLILAPREAARFEAVAQWLHQHPYRSLRRSQIRDGRVPAEAEIVLLDSLGELSGLYANAQAAFIGGTFVARINGHSPAEAAAVGCPIIHGPFTRSNAAAFDALETFLAHEPEDLAEALREALQAPRLPAAGQEGRARLEKIVDALLPELERPIPPERALRPLLWPLGLMWLFLAQLRPRPLHKARIPVISVGALTAGGAGKTPVAGWLAERIIQKGLSQQEPVIVARGYGRRAGKDVRQSGEAVDIGDELAMMLRRGYRIASCPDRRRAVDVAAGAGAGVAILDDGLQYGQIARNLEVVVVDARWPTGGGPIPVGERRLPLSALERADVIWVHHGPLPPELLPYKRSDALVVQAHYRPTGWLRRGQQIALEDLPKKPVLALCGIARPERFSGMLRQLGIKPERMVIYPDHHTFTWMDLQNIEAWLDDHVVVTTEKDAARLPRELGVHALLVTPQVDVGLEVLDERLRSILKS